MIRLESSGNDCTMGAGFRENSSGNSVYSTYTPTTTGGSGYYKGMAVFTVAKGGLMYEASIGGQKFSYTPK